MFESGDVTGEIVDISLEWVPDSFVEFTICGELFRCGIGSLDSSCTKNTSESTELIDIFEAIFTLFLKLKIDEIFCLLQQVNKKIDFRK